MFDMLVKNKEELNITAKHLRDIHNFDELRRLSKEWLVPFKDVENFITGKRCCLVEIEIEDKEYATAEEKLREEMWILKDRDFADILSQHLLDKCREDIFSSLILQKHKTLLKCLNYVMEQAYQIAEKKQKALEADNQEGVQNIGLALSEVQVYKWAEEYYALDDAKEEAERKEEEKRAIEKEHEQVQLRKKAEKTNVCKKVKGSTVLLRKAKESEKNKEEQMSLFDMMKEATREEESESV